MIFSKMDLSKEHTPAIPLPQGLWSNRLAWGPSKLTHVTLQDMRTLPLHNIQSNQVQCGWVWSLKVPPRVKTFLWRLAWERLPSKVLLAHYHIIPIDDRFYDLCPHQEENSAHHII